MRVRQTLHNRQETLTLNPNRVCSHELCYQSASHAAARILLPPRLSYTLPAAELIAGFSAGATFDRRQSLPSGDAFSGTQARRSSLLIQVPHHSCSSGYCHGEKPLPATSPVMEFKQIKSPAASGSQETEHAAEQGSAQWTHQRCMLQQRD